MREKETMTPKLQNLKKELRSWRMLAELMIPCEPTHLAVGGGSHQGAEV